MEIKPIHTDADYKATLREVSGLIDLDPEPATPEGDRLDILAGSCRPMKRSTTRSPCPTLSRRSTSACAYSGERDR